MFLHKSNPRIRMLLLLAAYLGTVFGVGMYGLPYILDKSGLLIFSVYLIVTAVLVYFVNAVFADVVLRTQGEKRFLGYIKEYIGEKAEHAFLIITLLGFWGTFLTFLLVWGDFAHALFGASVHIPAVAFSMFFFIITLFIISRGSRAIEWLDIILLAAAGIVLIVLFIKGFPYIKSIPLGLPTRSGLVLPYGALMFALWGAGIIPEIANQSRANIAQLKKILFIGNLIAVLVYLAFAVFVVSVSGNATTKEAMTGLAPFLGRFALVIGASIGMVTIFLSYNNLGWVARSMLMHDYRMDRFKALSLIFLPPLTLMLFGLTNVITIMSINGAILLGLQGLMIFVLYQKSHILKEKTSKIFHRHIPHAWIRIGILILLIGVSLEAAKIVVDLYIH